MNIQQPTFNLMRAFNKHVFNRLTRKFAGVSRTPFAIIRHVGRRSGKPYETPIIAVPVAGGFVVALTYGPEVNWYRNVLAAGRCMLLWHGKEYAIEKLEPIGVEAALPTFALPLRLVLRIRGTQDFVTMKYQAGE